jgi:MHS family alpha-ketoglutarate permease-like MFS transporter
MLYQWAKGAKQMDAFIIYATVVMFISLLVYIFFLKNKGENWLDHEHVMHTRHGKR